MEPVQGIVFLNPLSQVQDAEEQGQDEQVVTHRLYVQKKIEEFRAACLKLQEIRNAEIIQLLKDTATFEQRIQNEKVGSPELELSRIDTALKAIRLKTFQVEYPVITRSVDELLMPFSNQNSTEFVCSHTHQSLGANEVDRDIGCDILKHFKSTSPLSPLQSIYVKQMDGSGLVYISLVCHESKRKELNDYLTAFGLHTSYAVFNHSAFHVIRPLLEKQRFQPTDFRLLDDLMSKALRASR